MSGICISATSDDLGSYRRAVRDVLLSSYRGDSAPGDAQRWMHGSIQPVGIQHQVCVVSVVTPPAFFQALIDRSA